MRFIGNIETTVGQVVKDLETIAKNHPDEVLTFPCYDFCNDNYVSGVRFLKNLGFLLLESSLDEYEALTVNQLIKELKAFDSKQKIVAQDGWRLVNLEHNEFWDEDFESDESSVIVLNYDDEICVGSGFKDIRLHSLGYLMEEMKDRFGDCQELRIVCLDENDEVYPLIDYHHDEDDKDGCDYLYLTDENGLHAMKVSDFINLDYDETHRGVAVNYTENGVDYVLRSIEIDEDGHSFFKTNIDGEDVIACRLGDIIRSDDIYGVVDAPGNTMTKDDFIVYLKDYYVPHLKALIEEDEEIAGREEDEFDCEFEDDEYVEHISMAEGRARAMEEVVRELETFLKKID
ncbi:MAG: hypothetical protein PUC72_09265 [Bacteroidales bacterium]|nr:hypothetical protein [Bacteroidales bacterium]